MDLSRGIPAETSLATRKLDAGAEFLLTQTHFGAQDLMDLRNSVSQSRDTQVPVFAGVQILERGGIDFGNIPDEIRTDLHSGRSGLEIAKDLAFALWSVGITAFYVIPTILPGGIRDYEAASELIEHIRSLPGSHHASNR